MLQYPPEIVAAPTEPPLSNVVFLPPPPIVSNSFSERLQYPPLIVEAYSLAALVYPPLTVE